MNLPRLSDIQQQNATAFDRAMSIFRTRDHYVFCNVHEAAPGYSCYIDLHLWFKSGEKTSIFGGTQYSNMLPYERDKYVCDDRAHHIIVQFPKYQSYLAFSNAEDYWLAIGLINQYIDYVPKAVCQYEGFTKNIELSPGLECNCTQPYKSHSSLRVEKYNSFRRKTSNDFADRYSLTWGSGGIFTAELTCNDGSSKYLMNFGFSSATLFMHTNQHTY